MSIKTHQLSLVCSDQIASNVKHFTFKDEGIGHFIPGQFITLHISHGDKVIRRSYSIANREQNGNIEFAASYVPEGIASELLFNLQPGDLITAAGPYGRLILKDEQCTRLFLISTGTGVTPYRAMLPTLSSLLKEDDGIQIYLLQGVQTHDDLLYHSEFEQWASQSERAHYSPCLSRVSPENCQAEQHSGYVQHKLLTYNPKVEGDVFYLCGNPNMVDDTFTHLKTLGITPQQVRREKYISK